jgi:hypothetical protein
LQFLQFLQFLHLAMAVARGVNIGPSAEPLGLGKGSLGGDQRGERNRSRERHFGNEKFNLTSPCIWWRTVAALNKSQMDGGMLCCSYRHLAGIAVIAT